MVFYVPVYNDDVPYACIMLCCIFNLLYQGQVVSFEIKQEMLETLQKRYNMASCTLGDIMLHT